MERFQTASHGFCYCCWRRKDVAFVVFRETRMKICERCYEELKRNGEKVELVKPIKWEDFSRKARWVLTNIEKDRNGVIQWLSTEEGKEFQDMMKGFPGAKKYLENILNL